MNLEAIDPTTWGLLGIALLLAVVSLGLRRSSVSAKNRGVVVGDNSGIISTSDGAININQPQSNSQTSAPPTSAKRTWLRHLATVAMVASVGSFLLALWQAFNATPKG